jgi:hypothetical protein
MDAIGGLITAALAFTREYLTDGLAEGETRFRSLTAFLLRPATRARLTEEECEWADICDATLIAIDTPTPPRRARGRDVASPADGEAQTSPQPTVSFSTPPYGSAAHHQGPRAQPTRSFAAMAQETDDIPAGQTDEDAIGHTTPPGHTSTATSESFKTATQTPLRPVATHAPTGRTHVRADAPTGRGEDGPLERSAIYTRTKDGKIIFSGKTRTLSSSPQRPFHVVARPAPVSARTQLIPYPAPCVTEPTDREQLLQAYQDARAFYIKTDQVLPLLDLCRSDVTEEDLVGILFYYGYRSASTSEEDARYVCTWQWESARRYILKGTDTNVPRMPPQQICKAVSLEDVSANVIRYIQRTRKMFALSTPEENELYQQGRRVPQEA